MNRIGRGASTALVLALGGCTIARPLLDRQMADAPVAACASVNGAHPLAAAGGGTPDGPPQCFLLFEEGEDWKRAKWSGGALRPGRTLIAIHKGGEKKCQGRFTHLIVTGGSAEAGQLELATWDVAARPGHMRGHRSERPFAQRTFGLASIDSATMYPVGARIRVTKGSFDPAGLCFKSY